MTALAHQVEPVESAESFDEFIDGHPFVTPYRPTRVRTYPLPLVVVVVVVALVLARGVADAVWHLSTLIGG